MHKGEFQYFWNDSSKFTKVYSGKHIQDILPNLKGAGNKMFWFIVQNLTKDAESITISFEDYAEFAKIKSRTVYYEGIMNLNEHNIIKRMSGDVYYINPLILFNGDRTKLLSEPEKEFQERLQLSKGLITRRDNIQYAK